ncbi:TetR family transcriptional regulator [Bacillus sp. REN3]|uniref:TetR/AcrR family transcriptional regulator n=1 Tax=Bacillus sp. REN3 TaxID=2802440 RepID=UPI001AEEA1F9|nr:TetR family transcriptional regulator [Bacillus sp. REN3]
MEAVRTDPRILRTRKLIMNAFVELANKKEFKDITIKDITTKATVNRATFYYHFIDKYDLLEKVLKEDLMTNVISEIAEHEILNKDTLASVFLSLTKFVQLLSSQCRRSYVAFASTIEAIIKDELEEFFYQKMMEQKPESERESIRVAAAILSWAIYGAFADWQKNSGESPEHYFEKAIPILTKGMDILAAD